MTALLETPGLICDQEPLTVYLGTHQPGWCRTAPLDVPLFISHRRLREVKDLTRLATFPRRHIAIDSGAFTELSMFGEFTTSPAEYVDALLRYDEALEIAWAAPQDRMCEPFMLERTGKDVRAHQEETVQNFLDLAALWPSSGAGDCPIMPVIQGWDVDSYHQCVDLYESAGVRLAEDYPVVGVGSVCRRQSMTVAGDIFRTLAERDLPLHGFGVKITGLRTFGRWLCTGDSMAWSYSARRSAPLPGCSGHKNCANCQTYAVQWYRRVVEMAEREREAARQAPDQPTLWEAP